MVRQAHHKWFGGVYTELWRSAQHNGSTLLTNR